MLVALPNGKKANLAIRSLLVPGAELKQETIDAIRNSAEILALQTAVDRWGESQELTVRDLNGADMAYANNVFTETSNATINQWNAMAFGAFTVARGTVIGIYGLRMQVILDATLQFPPITGVRVDVGGARVVQWHTQCIDSYVDGASTAPLVVIAGFSKSPVIAQEDVTVTIFEYTRTASTIYVPVWMGIAVEKVGLTLRP